jgi:hypothetical protein
VLNNNQQQQQQQQQQLQYADQVLAQLVSPATACSLLDAWTGFLKWWACNEDLPAQELAAAIAATCKLAVATFKLMPGTPTAVAAAAAVGSSQRGSSSSSNRTSSSKGSSRGSSTAASSSYWRSILKDPSQALSSTVVTLAGVLSKHVHAGWGAAQRSTTDVTGRWVQRGIRYPVGSECYD